VLLFCDIPALMAMSLFLFPLFSYLFLSHTPLYTHTNLPLIPNSNPQPLLNPLRDPNHLIGSYRCLNALYLFK
jgi:hypothetical protein